MPKTLATATVDQLLHHAHVCQTSGDSVRLNEALAGRGVRPLAEQPTLTATLRADPVTINEQLP